MLVDVASSRFDRPLTYLVPPNLTLAVGHVVRVPFGRRQAYGFVITPMHDGVDTGYKLIAAQAQAPRAFDQDGLELARWIADRYLCSLREALSAVMYGGAVPRAIDRLYRRAQPAHEAARSVPPRLIALIWEDFEDGFTLASLLHHPEARRIGDRAALLRHLVSLVRSGSLERRRDFGGPRMRERRIAMLAAGASAAHGPRLSTLQDHLRAQGPLSRADAVLAGYSASLIARGLASGALSAYQERHTRAPIALHQSALIPTSAQAAAIARIEERLRAAKFAEILLHGITGSGKTLVYIESIRRILAAGGRAIMLVPEISLTPQTARRFEAAFGERVAVLHSALSERERYENWQAAARGELEVIVGARSAVFAPLADVRLIVIDEAHESSYKQDSSPRYATLEVARERMRRARGTLLLGSATPPLERYAAAQAGEIDYIELRERATQAPIPVTRIVDMSAELAAGNKRIFSSVLVEALGACLGRGEKAVLFVNRRGSAGFMLCRTCGFVPECPRCSVSLALHRGEGKLRCHYCDFQSVIPRACPQCASDAFREFGVGTERVAEEVTRLFGQARIVRMDSDTTTRIGSHARLLDEFASQADILVGTQMVAKGLDFPTVTLVGVVAADIGLHMADFRAAERTFGLITQVAGRSGRTGPGQAIVQTYAAEHPAIVAAAAHDFAGFAERELEERRPLAYPPFGALIYLGVIGRSRSAVLDRANAYAADLTQASIGEILGPAPYPIAKLNTEWRYRIAIKTADAGRAREVIRRRIIPAAHNDRTTRLVVNVDP